MAIDYTKRPSPPPPATEQPTSISLTKAAPRVNLAKGGDGQGAMRVNLNWTAQKPSGGFLAKLAAAANQIDLDLGCLYELADGSRGVIQALGNSFGALDSPPYILLDGDDRSGSNSAGENMHINLARPEQFRRVLVFAMIYQGAPNWAAVDGVVTLFPTSGPQVEVRLDSAENKARICAVALIESDGRTVSVQREVQYVTGSQADLDKKYGFGLQWKAGRK
ncbi:TerD family protein [Actinomycetes bacterium M1A6_2h]